MDVKRAFLEGNVDEEIHIKLRDSEEAWVRWKADQSVVWNKVSLLSVTEGCKGEFEDTWTRCLTIPCLLENHERDVIVGVYVTRKLILKKHGINIKTIIRLHHHSKEFRNYNQE